MKCVLGVQCGMRESGMYAECPLLSCLSICLSLKTSSLLAVQRTAGCCTSTSVATLALPCSTVLCRASCDHPIIEVRYVLLPVQTH